MTLTVTDRTTVRPPERVGKYPIVRILGEGAMGVVYEAFDPVIRRPLAIKTIRRALMDSDAAGAAAVARFKTEARAAGGLAHPGIAAVYEYGEDPLGAYIAMEFVNGNTLRDYIARGTRFAEEDVLAIMAQLLSALGYAHARGVLHRDIKPANLMITRDGRLKVTDFGIARVEANGITLDGAIIGTPGYMAPEQFSGEDIDHRVDLYAAAATLYQVLTGRPPFSGALEKVMYQTVMSDPVPPSTIEGADHWAHLDAVVMRGLARDRDARFASAHDFAAALTALARRTPADTVSEHTLIMDHGLRGGARADGGTARADGGASPSGGLAPRTASGGMIGSGGTNASGATQAWTGVSATRLHALETGWDVSTLDRVESELARHIGPMAKVLVRRAARETTDLSTLRARLADQLPTDAERIAFLGGTANRPPAGGTWTGGTRTAAPSTAASTTVRSPGSGGRAGGDEPLTDALLEHATRTLTKRIGPIARLMVRRAAAQAPNRDGFGRALAALVAESTDAEAVLADLAEFPGRQ